MWGSPDFWAGYLSGAAGIIVGNPLDIVKVRLQAHGHPTSASRLPRPNAAAPSPSPSTGQLHRSAAAPPHTSHLAGLPAPILTYGALNALLFVSYNRALALLDPSCSRGGPVSTDTATTTTTTSSSSPPAVYNLLAAGCIAGLATFIVSAPTELVKCRAQLAPPSSTSSWAITKRIVAVHGPRGLYFGGAVTALRDAVGYAFYFAAYELSVRSLGPTYAGGGGGGGGPYADAARTLLCGGVAGIATWVSIFPLDVVKTRVQTQPAFLPVPVPVPVSVPVPVHVHVPRAAAAAAATAEQAPLLHARPGGTVPSSLAPSSAPAPRILGAVDVARIAWRTEGWRVFVRGLGVCCARAFVVNAVQWGVYEWVMRGLGAVRRA